MFSGVKVFSATKARERGELGDTVTRWLASNSDVRVVDRVVIQSSDSEFHCLSMVLFYDREVARSRPPGQEDLPPLNG